MDLSRYRALLRVSGIPRLLFSSILGRMTAGMGVLSIVLTVQATTGSFAAAGAVAGAFTVASALGAPLQGRVIDRVGQPPVLLTAVSLFSLAFFGLALAARAGLPVGVLMACAALAGLTVPSLSASMRSLWSAELGRQAPGTPARTRSAAHVADTAPYTPGRTPVPVPTLQTAYALDSTLQELIFISGPMLVALLVALSSPLAAMLVAIVLGLAGTVTFATAPASRAWRGEPAAKDWAGPLRVTGIRTVVLAMLLVGGGIGLVEVSVPAFAAAHGRPEIAGILLACWSAGSLLGGLVYGGREWPGTASSRYLVLGWLIPLSFVPMALAGTLTPLALALPLAGCFFAPFLATANVLVEELAPPGNLTEAFTWIYTGFVTGIAAGISGGGNLIEWGGTRAATTTAVACVAAGALLGAAARATVARR